MSNTRSLDLRSPLPYERDVFTIVAGIFKYLVTASTLFTARSAMLSTCSSKYCLDKSQDLLVVGRFPVVECQRLQKLCLPALY